MAQTTGSQRNSITVDCLGLLFNTGNIQYNLKLNQNQSLALRGSYWYWNLDDYQASGPGVGLVYHLFLDKSSLNGIYLGPTVQFIFWSAENTFPSLGNGTIMAQTEKRKATWYSAGLEIGYCWILDNGFTIDLYTGLRFLTGDSLNMGGDKLDLKGLNWNGLGLGLGYAF